MRKLKDDLDKLCEKHKVFLEKHILHIIVVLAVIGLIIGVLLAKLMPTVASVFFEFFRILTMPIVTVLIAIKVTKVMNDENTKRTNEMTNQNRIDGASDWRKELMDIASKEVISKDDIYRIRASLRFKAKYTEDEFQNKLHSNEPFFSTDEEFDYMSAHISNVCDFLVKEPIYIIINEKNQDNLRAYTRYLLKSHWEFYINFLEADKENKIKIAMKDVAKDTLILTDEYKERIVNDN